MSFIKFVSPADYFKDEAPVSMVKVSQRRQFNTDKVAFEKRAGRVFNYEEIIKTARPGEYLVHVIALGCDEVYGPNRNGDAFSVDTCRKFHDTFKKYAHWFREHDHDDPRKSFGYVKASAFNEREGRIELIVALNATKEAAQRNKGRVADKEIDLLESGKDVAVSMACKVAYDQCSGCGNRARNRSEYCTDSTCKYGGLKENIGRAFDDGHILRAFNPEPKFFDISFVGRPADRIAYSVGVVKSGSVNWLYPLPTESEVKKQLHILSVLAFLEAKHESDVKVASCLQSSAFRVKEAVEKVKYYDIPEAVWALTKVGILLPVEDFLSLFNDYSEDQLRKIGRSVRTNMSDAFRSLLTQDDVLEQLENNFFYPRSPGFIPKTVQEDLEKIAYEKSIVMPRHIDTNIKFASYNSVKRDTDPRIRELAETYALYQLASLSEWSADRELAYRNTVVLNRTL